MLQKHRYCYQSSRLKPYKPPVNDVLHLLTYIFLCLSISAFFSSSSFLCFSSAAVRLLSVRPNMSTLSTGDVPLARSLFDLDLERDSRRRFLFASRDRERFLLLSQSRDRDLERLLRFLLCLLPPFECFDRDELRLLERPIPALAKLQLNRR